MAMLCRGDRVALIGDRRQGLVVDLKFRKGRRYLIVAFGGRDDRLCVPGELQLVKRASSSAQRGSAPTRAQAARAR